MIVISKMTEENQEEKITSTPNAEILSSKAEKLETYIANENNEQDELPISRNNVVKILSNGLDSKLRPQDYDNVNLEAGRNAGNGMKQFDDNCFTVSLVDVNYSVKAYWRSKSKQILHNISLHFEPGLNGILGPSGCGKTTILDLMACHKPMQKKHLSGHILVNGNSIPPNTFRAISAYVPQDDNLSEFLTVRENLMFSANMRMVGKSSVEKLAAVDRMIELLHLERCHDTLVGNFLIRGISTGEKKRTCIAMELLLEPQILLLDEPTTGLDSFSANEIVNCLTKVANENGRTIIMSLHQPRYSIFKKLDNLTLLTVDGRLAYHGLAKNAKSYFEQRDYFCEVAENPCDFFLDLVQSYAHEAGSGSTGSNDHVTFSSLCQSNDVHPQMVENKVANGGSNMSVNYDDTTAVITVPNGTHKMTNQLSKYNTDKSGSKSSSPSVGKHTLARLFHSSDEMGDMRKRIESTFHCEKIEASRSYQPFSTQMKTLFARDVRQLYRNPECLFGQVIIATMLSVLFGALYWQSELSPDRGFQNRHGLFFFLSLSLMMMNLAHIELFISQQKLFFHEYANGFFYMLPYFLSNTLFDLLTLRVVPAVIMGVTLTYSVGLRSDVDSMFFFLLMLILLAVSGCGVAYLTTSILKTFYISHIAVMLVFVVMMVFAGLIINLKTLPEWVELLKYVSLVYYGVSGLSVNEFLGLEFCGQTSINAACPGMEMALSQATISDENEGDSISRAIMKFLSTPETADKLFSQQLDICVEGKAGLDIQGIDYENVNKYFYALMVAVGALIAYTLTFVRLYFSNRR
ncbi:broad substrate specificity ATP-binding cassette transporter ABCG2-like [Symsagittifera roscoffensis]|uniref:broad substrate specificity ATP-binding cassette transporter ABCG2-like n=1 Tax=Symsagittifera roscoffensis TaxID=84072 RepID=UPI00307BD2A9